MPIPTAYTEATLSAFMNSQLGKFPTAFGWTGVVTDYQEAVNDTLLAYGVNDIAQALDIKKLRAIACVQAWKQVTRRLANQFAFTADGATYNRQQMHEMAIKELALAEAEAAVYGGMPGYQVGVGSIEWKNDPYRYPLSDDEVN
jgi:hypothetical protein